MRSGASAIPERSNGLLGVHGEEPDKYAHGDVIGNMRGGCSTDARYGRGNEEDKGFIKL